MSDKVLSDLDTDDEDIQVPDAVRTNIGATNNVAHSERSTDVVAHVVKKREKRTDEPSRKRRRSPRGGVVKSESGYAIFVTGLPSETHEEDVLDAFSEYGHVNSVRIDRDRRTGLVKGYAIIAFSDADAATKSLGMKVLMGQNIEVDWAFRNSR